MPPVGLLGEATMMSLVFGVMAAMNLSKGELERGVGLDTDKVPRHELHADVVHEEGGRGDEGFVIFFQEGEAKEADGLVDAVGEEELFGCEVPKCAATMCSVRLALGILGEILRKLRDGCVR